MRFGAKVHSKSHFSIIFEKFNANMLKKQYVNPSCERFPPPPPQQDLSKF